MLGSQQPLKDLGLMLGLGDCGICAAPSGGPLKPRLDLREVYGRRQHSPQ